MSNCIYKNKYLPGQDKFITSCYDSITGDKVECSECESCPDDNQCWFDQFIEGGLDNTGTSFRHTNQVYTVYLNDGSTCTFNIASATNWTDQVTQISAGLDTCLDAVESVPYCTIGCGGLPAPFLELPDMLWRYSGFKMCPGKPFPIKVEYTSDQLTTPRVLVLNTILSEKIYLDRCFDCGKSEVFYLRGTDEEFTPFCPKPCGEPEFLLPEAVCSFTFRDGCDQGTNPVTAITLQYVDCGEGELLSSIYTLDADGGLEEYTPIGPVDDCNGGIIDEPEPNLCDIVHTILQGCVCVDTDICEVDYALDCNGDILWIKDRVTREIFEGTLNKDCCDCGTCESAPFCVRGFDYQDLDTWENGSMEWETPAGTSIDQPSAQDNGSKGSWYTNLIANVNSNAGWTMSIATDVPSDNSGDDKPVFQFVGPCDSELVIVRNGGDTLTLTVDSEGVMTGTFTKSGNNIESETFVSCPVEDGDNDPIGDQVQCASAKLGSDINSTASGNAVHTLDSLYTGAGPLLDWNGTFTIIDNLGASHTLTNGGTITGLAPGATQSVTYTGMIHYNNGTEFRCNVDKLISANFTVL